MELVMNLSLVLILFKFFFDFPLKYLEKLWLEQHFLDGDENFKDHFEYLTLSKLKPNTIWNHNLIVN